MIKIALIGAGQIGSRHLQGMKLFRKPCNIQVMDVSEDSLKVAEERFNQVEDDEFQGTVEFVTSLDSLSDNLDFVVIATSATYRAQIVKDLLLKSTVGCLILEKVLFQKSEDYHEIGELISQKGIETYVNCPRRYFPTYQKIKGKVSFAESISMRVHGSSWRMASNGIHFVDLFQFLTGESVHIDSHCLDQNVIESKHGGLMEVTGTFFGRSKSGKHNFSLTCLNEGVLPLQVEVYTGEKRYIIQESVKPFVLVQDESTKGEFTKETYELLYQSQLTGLIFNDILEGKCSLTKFEDSSEIHLEFIDNMLSHIEKVTNTKLELCPIT